jgi:NAD(P)-dependent dehydrogenase (short-subunit alcohol dehydrogenase family)
MTKTAQIAIARGIAETVAGTDITVNSVLAGPTR